MWLSDTKVELSISLLIMPLSISGCISGCISAAARMGISMVSVRMHSRREPKRGVGRGAIMSGPQRVHQSTYTTGAFSPEMDST